MVFHAPKSMKWGETRTVHLILSPSRPFKAIEADIQKEIRKGLDLLEHRKVQYANRMEAELIGDGFKITPITPKRQVVSTARNTTWKWDIKSP